MTLRVPNVGEVLMLKNIVNNTAPQNLILMLNTNDVNNFETDVTANYTEASGAGYANVTLTGTTWAINSADPSNATYAQQTFTFTGSLGNVYGYFIAETTSGILKWAERFSNGPFDIQNNGDQIKVTPIITLKDTLD